MKLRAPTRHEYCPSGTSVIKSKIRKRGRGASIIKHTCKRNTATTSSQDNTSRARPRTKHTLTRDNLKTKIFSVEDASLSDSDLFIDAPPIINAASKINTDMSMIDITHPNQTTDNILNIPTIPKTSHRTPTVGDPAVKHNTSPMIASNISSGKTNDGNYTHVFPVSIVRSDEQPEPDIVSHRRPMLLVPDERLIIINTEQAEKLKGDRRQITSVTPPTSGISRPPVNEKTKLKIRKLPTTFAVGRQHDSITPSTRVTRSATKKHDSISDTSRFTKNDIQKQGILGYNFRVKKL